MVQEGTDELKIKQGSNHGREFSADTLTWSTQLPLDGSLIELADTNGDQRQDLLIGYGPGDGEGMPSRLRGLVSKPAGLEDDTGYFGFR